MRVLVVEDEQKVANALREGPDTGQAKLSVEVVDLRDLAENVAAHLGVLAEEKAQSLTIEHLGIPRCFGDRLVLRQALINLADNTIKYTPVDGQIHIHVSASLTSALLDVRGTGPGIAAERRAQIFDRFYGAGRSRSGERGGAGRSLSIAKWAVEVNRGQISLEDANGGGSTLRITLPSADAARTQDDRRLTATAYHG